MESGWCECLNKKGTEKQDDPDEAASSGIQPGAHTPAEKSEAKREGKPLNEILFNQYQKRREKKAARSD